MLPPAGAELERLHAAARGPRGGFSGGAESAEIARLLAHGGGVEKQELVSLNSSHHLPYSALSNALACSAQC
jgi:hypothetical protein